MKLICKNHIARLTSIIVNPFMVHIIMILIISFKSTDSTAEGVRWFLIPIAISTVPIFIIVLYLVRYNKVDSFFIKIRSQRDKVYILSLVLMVIACAVLFFLRAPVMLVALFIAIFIAGLVFACVNRWWKISIHVASISAAVTALVILYGPVAAWTILLVPLVAWARVEMEHHSLAQVLAGGLLSSLILLLVFLFFNLV
jgi:membrane-associated phospholipid phosphatase